MGCRDRLVILRVSGPSVRKLGWLNLRPSRAPALPALDWRLPHPSIKSLSLSRPLCR